MPSADDDQGAGTRLAKCHDAVVAAVDTTRRNIAQQIERVQSDDGGAWDELSRELALACASLQDESEAAWRQKLKEQQHWFALKLETVRKAGHVQLSHQHIEMEASHARVLEETVASLKESFNQAADEQLREAREKAEAAHKQLVVMQFRSATTEEALKTAKKALKVAELDAAAARTEAREARADATDAAARLMRTLRESRVSLDEVPTPPPGQEHPPLGQLVQVLLAAFEDTRAHVRALDAERAELRTRLAEAEAQAAAATEDVKAADARAAAARDELEAAGLREAELQQQVSGLQAAVVEASREHAALQLEMTSLKEELAAAHEEAAEMRHRTASGQETLEAQLAQLRAQLSAVDQRVRGCAAQLADGLEELAPAISDEVEGGDGGAAASAGGAGEAGSPTSDVERAGSSGAAVDCTGGASASLEGLVTAVLSAWRTASHAEMKWRAEVAAARDDVEALVARRVEEACAGALEAQRQLEALRAEVQRKEQQLKEQKKAVAAALETAMWLRDALNTCEAERVRWEAEALQKEALLTAEVERSECAAAQLFTCLETSSRVSGSCAGRRQKEQASPLPQQQQRQAPQDLEKLVAGSVAAGAATSAISVTPQPSNVAHQAKQMCDVFQKMQSELSKAQAESESISTQLRQSLSAVGSLTSTNLSLGELVGFLVSKYEAALDALEAAGATLQQTTQAMEQSVSAARAKEAQLTSATLTSLRSLRAHLTHALGAIRAEDASSVGPPIRIRSLYASSGAPGEGAGGNVSAAALANATTAASIARAPLCSAKTPTAELSAAQLRQRVDAVNTSAEKQQESSLVHEKQQQRRQQQERQEEESPKRQRQRQRQQRAVGTHDRIDVELHGAASENGINPPGLFSAPEPRLNTLTVRLSVTKSSPELVKHVLVTPPSAGLSAASTAPHRAYSKEREAREQTASAVSKADKARAAVGAQTHSLSPLLANMYMHMYMCMPRVHVCVVIHIDYTLMAICH